LTSLDRLHDKLCPCVPTRHISKVPRESQSLYSSPSIHERWWCGCALIMYGRYGHQNHASRISARYIMQVERGHQASNDRDHVCLAFPNGPGSTTYVVLTQQVQHLASDERVVQGRISLPYYNLGAQGAQFLLHPRSFLLLPYDTVGVSAVAQPPCIPNVYSPVSAQRGASEFSPSMHQEQDQEPLSKFTEHAHQAGSPKARTIRHAAASCWNVRLQPSVITHHKRFQRTT
jgi:hypothetical protein